MQGDWSKQLHWVRFAFVFRLFFRLFSDCFPSNLVLFSHIQHTDAWNAAGLLRILSVFLKYK